jgi:hypothetical protein
MVHFVFWTPWYIEPRGQFSSMVYWTSLLKNEPPLYGKLSILNPLIFNQEIGRGFDIPWVEGGVNILWVGVRNTMGRGFDIPWIGVQNAMGRGSKYHEYGVRFWLLRWCQNTYLCPKLPNAFPFFFFGSIFGGIVAHRIWPMTFLYRIYPFFFLTQLILKNSSRTIAVFENAKLHFHDNHVIFYYLLKTDMKLWTGPFKDWVY